MNKKLTYTFALFATVIFTLLFIGSVSAAGSAFLMEKASDEYVASLDALLETRKNEILATESEWTLGEGGTVWYVSSSEGDNNNDGKSAASPVATVAKIRGFQNRGMIKPGDVVLFKRGDVWNEKLTCAEGVTYSAYGEGAKPELRGSYDASGADQWELVEGTTNLYKFKKIVTSDRDAGTIVFNLGEGYGLRLMETPGTGMLEAIGDNGLVSNGYTYWTLPVQAFHDQNDLVTIGNSIAESDLMYYHNWSDSRVYLLSKKGNPGAIFDNIQISTKGNVVKVPAGEDNVTIDNLAIKYGASHGVGAGTVNNLTVRNCDIGWIGGAIQRAQDLTRLGNAVEIYGGCDGFYVYNNYMYEIFDCGPTIQWQGTLKEGETMVAKNVDIYDNAMWSTLIEAWYTTSKENTETTYTLMENCKFRNNLISSSGYGFKGYFHQKTGYAAFYGAAATATPMIDCYIENNTIWNTRRNILKAVPTSVTNGKGFIWRNNTIVHEYEREFGLMASKLKSAAGGYKQYWYNNDTIRRVISDGAFEANNKFMYTLKEGQTDPAPETPAE